MNPEKRFGQIEEILAEALIKIDRIEDLATKTFGLAETAHSNGEITARGLASLTIENQRAHQKLSDKIDDVKQQLDDKIDDVKQQLDDKIDDVKQQLDDKLNSIQGDITNLKEGQQQIMNFLREKFS